MDFYNSVRDIFVTCPLEMAEYLEVELKDLDYPILEKRKAGIMTEGTMEDCMVLNMNLRCGHRVLYNIADYRAHNAQEMYNKINKMPWYDIIDPDGYVSVASSVINTTIRDTRFANMRCKDAIVDCINSEIGRRPDSGPDETKAVIFLFWRDRELSVYIDTSGEPLSRRGYRKEPWKAPMQETLAAAVVKATGFEDGTHMLNPMCGSGTIAIEAAMIAANIPPGLVRHNFGFMHILGYDKNVWMKVRNTAKSNIKKIIKTKILASDIDKRAIECAIKNARTAGVEKFIEFKAHDFRKTPDIPGDKILIMNPEYGKRMGDVKALESTYKEMGDFFKQKMTGTKCYIFTGNLELGKKVGLKTSKKLVFHNSKIECRLLEYGIY